MRAVYGALLVSALCAGCADGPPGTLAPPALQGADVVRGPFGPGVLSGDAGLAVAVAFDEPFADHCADFESPDQPGSTQVVLPPSGGAHIKASARHVSVTVYQVEGPLFSPCTLVGAPIVGSGFANITLTASQGGPGADIVVVTIHGIVDLTGGGQARLSATTQVLIRPDDSFAFDHTRISLRPL